MYYIDIENIQKVETEIVHLVCDICEKAQIPYYLEAGSALGAVRHKGPIPWDNDADIGIPFDRIDEFCKLFENNPDKRFYISYCKTDKKSSSLHPDIFARGIDGRTCHVDIFPYVWLGEDEKDNSFRLSKIKDIQNKINYIRCNYIGTRDLKGIKIKVKRVLHRLKCFTKKLKLKNIKYYLDEYDALCSKVSFDNAKYVVDPLSEYDEKEIMPKEWLGNRSTAKYGGRKASVYENVDGYLTKLYGDYMSFPPKNIIDKQMKAISRINKKEFDKFWGKQHGLIIRTK